MTDYLNISIGEELADRLAERRDEIVREVEPILRAERVEEGTRQFDQKLEELRRVLRDCQALNSKLTQMSAMKQLCQLMGDAVQNQHVSVDYRRGVKPDVFAKDSTVRPAANPSTGTGDQKVSSTQESSTSFAGGVLAPISLEEFNSIPRYMRGRMSCAELNEVVSKINEFFSLKRRLLDAPFNKLRKEEKNLVCKWREKETSSNVGRIFFQEADIKPGLKIRTQAIFRHVSPCLRHVRRIREVREKGQIYYLPYQD
ncbi:hypothetical protein KIN20_025385 [Parelaphostrongylus tenuis]|uniref:SKA complex subunit 1 n=1 Tax=Parelaphostrongylus tenuis TaxID=148309 RepID=A0AAD5QXS0_PARTN|nr:hypothetical protein KIN20_025385 [Parelaphostrongylus tenuis]